MKRFLIGTVMAITLVMALAVPSLAEQPYMYGDRSQWAGDAAPAAWAQADVDDAIRYEFFTGYPRGTYPLDLGDFFRSDQYPVPYPDAVGKTVTLSVTPEFHPQTVITRAEFAAILARATGFSDGYAPGSNATYGDVDSGAWYYPFLDALAQKGVVQPDDSDGRLFRPGAPISRLDIGIWSARAARAYGLAVTPAATRFTDAPGIPVGTRGDVGAAVALGVVKGYPDGSLRPDAMATRAEAAVMLMRLVRRLTLHLATKADLMAAVQASDDARNIFLRDHKPGWQVVASDWSLLAKWFTPGMLTWWYTPPGEPCTTQYNWQKQFTCYESIASLPEGTAESRFGLTDWYGAALDTDVQVVEVSDRTARLEVSTFAQPIPYDNNRGLSQYKTTMTIYLRQDGGRWKYAAESGVKILRIDHFVDKLASRNDGKTLVDIP